MSLQAPSPKVSDQFGSSISSSRVLGGTVIVTSTPFFSLFDNVVTTVGIDDTGSNAFDAYV